MERRVKLMEGEIRPDYYDPSGTYEPWKVIDAWGLDFYAGTALKHLNRAASLKKPGSSKVEELQKALTYVKAALDRAKLAERPKAEILIEGNCSRPDPIRLRTTIGPGGVLMDEG